MQHGKTVSTLKVAVWDRSSFAAEKEKEHTWASRRLRVLVCMALLVLPAAVAAACPEGEEEKGMLSAARRSANWHLRCSSARSASCV